MPDSSKSEKPTPRRRQKAREQGQVVRSREMIAGLATVTAVLVLAAAGSSFTGQWRALLRRTLDTSTTGEIKMGTPLFGGTGLAALQMVGLVLGLSWLVAMLTAMAQGGLVFAPQALTPNLSRFSPAARLEQLFSLTAVGRLLKSLLPGTAVVCVAVSILMRDWRGVMTLPHQNVRGLATFGFGHIYEIAWKSALALVVWSAADYFIERQHMEGELRMSRQDLMDEYKETEGHPAIKARLRRVQRQMRKRRMLEDVKRASVVITNPTEFAIALEYTPLMAAPVVMAKGRNLVARQIKEIARWQGIPLVENPPLAHALYRAVEVGQSIPPKLYTVVAGILAAIYRAQERATQTAQTAGGGR